MARTTVDGKTIADAYLRRIEISRDEPAHLSKQAGQYLPITWSEIHSRVLGIFKSYQKMGLLPGDKVCILSQTRSEWNIVDLANLSTGIITVPIYHSSLPEDVAFLIEHSGAKLIVIAYTTWEK